MAESFPRPSNQDPSISGDIPGQSERLLRPEEIVIIDTSEPLTSLEGFSYYDGDVIRAPRLATLRLGGRSTYSEVHLLDLRNCPAVDYVQADIKGKPPVAVREIGLNHDDKPIETVGDYLMLVPSLSGSTDPEVRPLVPDSSWEIGRDIPLTGSQVAGLEPTVSRRHCIVGMNEDGEIYVENLTPSNQTVVVTAPRTATNPRVRNLLEHKLRRRT